MSLPSEVTIEPCPFCGPDTFVSCVFDDVSQRHRVYCGACGASSGIHPYDRTMSVAIAAWNRRPPPEAQYTYGHCPERSKPGGCQRHNLQCGYPNCDRRAKVSPHPEEAKMCEACGGIGQIGAYDEGCRVCGGTGIASPPTDGVASAAAALIREIDENDPSGPEAGMDSPTLEKLGKLRAALSAGEK